MLAGTIVAVEQALRQVNAYGKPRIVGQVDDQSKHTGDLVMQRPVSVEDQLR